MTLGREKHLPPGQIVLGKFVYYLINEHHITRVVLCYVLCFKSPIWLTNILKYLDTKVHVHLPCA